MLDMNLDIPSITSDFATVKEIIYVKIKEKL
jgi:hypothetical protein